MMNNVKSIIVALLIIAFGYAAPAFALPGESIVLDPSTGNYLITYFDDDDGAFNQITFIPSTKINPTLKSKLRLDGLMIQYHYTMFSGRDSKQNIFHIILDPIKSVATPTPIPPVGSISGDAVTPAFINSIADVVAATSKAAHNFETPPSWISILHPNEDGKTFRASWFTKVAKALLPGGRVDFGFKSLDLPGIIQAEIKGYAPDSENIPGEQAIDENDVQFSTQYHALMNNDFVPRPAAVPNIAVPAPFDAAVLLDRIQSQMHTWIGMKLLDPIFSGQLDRYLTAAAEAYRHNQPKAAKEDIERVREMLKKEHQDLGRDEEHENSKNHEKNDDKKPASIDRLAAKVLDFDLMYVLKRTGEND